MLVAGSLAGPRQAAASCGDYVVYRGSHGQMARYSPLHLQQALGRMVIEHLPSGSVSPIRPAEPKPPCHGPACQRSPQPLDPLPATAAPLRFPPAILLASAMLGDPLRSFCSLETGAKPHPGYLLPILQPPIAG